MNTEAKAEADLEKVFSEVGEQRLVEILTDLVNIASPTGYEREIGEYLASFFERLGVLGRDVGDSSWLSEDLRVEW